MIADLLLDAELAELPPHADSTYAQHHPLQVAVCLRKLMAGQDFVTVEFNGRQIVTQVLDVDSRNARFIFDAGSTELDNYALPAARKLIFRSLPGGIRTEFMTLNANTIMFEARPAFEASFPSLLYYVQRREFFRVQTPVLDPYIASGPYVDGEGGSFRLELQDLSLGGVALKTADERFGSLESGTVLRDVTLQLGSFGTLRLDLEIVASRQLTTPKGDRRFVIGCKFVKTPGPAERTLQRVVTQLETKRQALAPRR
ncbi:c-di-GMP-binding flagellar brake protein YcgR [Paraburkholderia sp. BL23I1N1]|uniref:flagellar brake protein n=1 Tax=Paraburkholderia sp. BL23I1N1 TaxID=1938802 RepID=UPI000E728F85|nr:flagellar brake protein [Paraburkholderia sp. BL23I1N1]RKE38320.1 c-di-GMP-binding flagellar brake protein YcgR [Paraburkholderia sp. BL23I1N1]